LNTYRRKYEGTSALNKRGRRETIRTRKSKNERRKQKRQIKQELKKKKYRNEEN
jgi:hypothetical protein